MEGRDKVDDGLAVVEGIGRSTEVKFVANPVTEGERELYATATVKGHSKHSKICIGCKIMLQQSILLSVTAWLH